MSKSRTVDLERMAGMFKALSNAHRLRIFLELASSCVGASCCRETAASVRRCVGDLGRDLGLAASTVSHHLKELRQAGLMQVERRGQKIECWISPDALRALADFIESAQSRAIDDDPAA